MEAISYSAHDPVDAIHILIKYEPLGILQPPWTSNYSYPLILVYKRTLNGAIKISVSLKQYNLNAYSFVDVIVYEEPEYIMCYIPFVLSCS